MDNRTPSPERLSSAGLVARVVVTGIIAAITLAGTLWGQDDHFPFGPFRMYSTTAELNQPVRDTRVMATNTKGREFELHAPNTGVKRADVEAQLGRFEKHPQLLKYLAQAYHNMQPNKPTIVHIEVIIRWREMYRGEPTGEYHDQFIVGWTRDGGQ